MEHQEAVNGRHVDAVLEIREVRVTTGERAGGFASSLLREIPILRIEAAINHPAHRRRITRILAADPTDGGHLPGGERYRVAPSHRPRPAERSLIIDDPGGYRKPDDFYRQVADLYLHLARSARPAHDLAEANGMPVATVHRWIREAKARGALLLPTHRGGGP